MKRDVADDLLERLGQKTEALDVLLTAQHLIDEMDDRNRAGEPASPLALTPEERRSFARSALSGAALAGRAIYDELVRKRQEEMRAEARREAEEVWSRLETYSWPERFELVDGSIREARTWALVELLCRKSLRMASHEPKVSVHLAELACHVAERMVGDARSVAHALSCAWTHLGNARRVASDLPGSERAFARAWEHWPAGEGSDLDLLPKWRLLDREASLRRDQGRFAEALAGHGEAFALCGGGEAAGRVLLNKASTLKEEGEYGEALKAVDAASTPLEGSLDRRLLFALLFTRADILAHLGRHQEVAQLLPGVRALAFELRRKIDLIRLTWLEARALLSQDRKPEALAAFERARREFTVAQLAYDTALVALEEAILLLKNGRTAEVRTMALEMRWIFKAQGVHQAALAALQLFCDAARQESASVELAQQVLEFLRVARRKPEFRFESFKAPSPVGEGAQR